MRCLRDVNRCEHMKMYCLLGKPRIHRTAMRSTSRDARVRPLSRLVVLDNGARAARERNKITSLSRNESEISRRAYVMPVCVCSLMAHMYARIHVFIYDYMWTSLPLLQLILLLKSTQFLCDVAQTLRLRDMWTRRATSSLVTCPSCSRAHINTQRHDVSNIMLHCRTA